MNTLEILQAGRNLISDPQRWTQGAFARDSEGDSTTPMGSRARCWCSMGAIQKTCENEETSWKGNTALLVLLEVIENLPESCSGLVFYNDHSTHAEVLALWDAAIENESLKGEKENESI